MEEKTFNQIEVIQELNKVKLLNVDVDKHPKAAKLQAEYEILGFRLLWVFGPDGKEVKRFVGFVNHNEFLEKLRTLPGWGVESLIINLLLG